MKVITIDGPAASGKSSIARQVASRLSCIYVNTGNMYRAVSWAVLRAGVDPEKTKDVENVAASMHLEPVVIKGRVEVFVDGEHLGETELNSDPVNRVVSFVARVPVVRTLLVGAQRELRKLGGIVMEGRDIGSVVFPESEFKFYIDASEEVRAARRKAQGLEDSVAERDRLDSTRTTSPLVIPQGATVIDNSLLSLDEAVEKVLEVLKKKGFETSVGG